MSDLRLAPSLARFAELELSFCRSCNRLPAGLIRLFSLVSRLGDGAIWIGALLLVLLLDQSSGNLVALRMLLLGVVGFTAYRSIKVLTARNRPYMASPGIELLAAPLDRYSFPSGHTLHAVAFSVLLIHHYPFLTWLLLPFALLVGASRVVLGLHYPTDVAAGALLGLLLARVVLYL